MSIVTGRLTRTEHVPHEAKAVRHVARRVRTRNVHLTDAVAPTAYARRRAWLDYPVAAALLVPGLPLIGLLLLLMRLSSPGPGLFRQLRVGKDGKPFRLYKIRTMQCDAETGTGAVWSPMNDPRVTRLGYWIRKLHLDELPQLINVLRGEMALIGPRPERPEFVAVLKDVVPGYATRTCVLPGITGLSQVNLPPDSNLCSVCRKMVLDIDYIRRNALLLDLRILVCTITRAFGIRSKRFNRIFGVQCEVRIAGGCRGGHGHAGSGLVAPKDVHCILTERLTQGLDTDLLHRKLHDQMTTSTSNGHSNGNGNGNGHTNGNGHSHKHPPMKPR